MPAFRTPTRRTSVRAALALVALVAGLLVAVTTGALGSRSVDGRTDSTAHRTVLDHPGLLRLARALTHLGAPLYVSVLTLLAAVVLLLLRRPRAAVYVVAVRLTTQLLDLALKDVVGRHRPQLAHPVAHAAGSSFPSGHAAGAASIYLPLTVVICSLVARPAIRRTAWGLAILLCLVVATTRVLLGVHYPSDVLAGLALGAAVTAALDPVLHRGGA